MATNVEPIFIRTPFHFSKILTTEVSASRDPGSALLVDLVSGGDDGALVTSLGTVGITGSLSTIVRLFIFAPGDAKAGWVFDLAIASSAVPEYATLPSLDASRKGLWVPAGATLQVALSSTVAGGVSVQVQGGYY